MSDGKRSVRRQRSLYRVHYALPRGEVMAQPWPPPPRCAAPAPALVEAYQAQVAGHTSDGPEYLGLLHCNNGTIMKPLLKPTQTREADFYNRLQSATERDLVELREFVPRYFGCRKFTYNGYEHDYIILEDLAVGMTEPCIMDVKIGRRTWDPLADERKISREQSKYAACRRQYAFCIPGYQVHRLPAGRRDTYGKEHGKRLNGKHVADAIRSYLNWPWHRGRGRGRSLVLQLVSSLWRAAAWSRRQGSVRLYAASVLLVYDAAALQSQPAGPSAAAPSPRPPPPCDSDFSGQLDAAGPVYKRVNPRPPPPATANHAPISSEWSEALDKSHRTHSFDNDYETNLKRMKLNYYALLDRLSGDAGEGGEGGDRPWVTVKVIDFAHAFFNETGEEGCDDNFREGIESLAAIFEELLKETEEI